MIYKLEDRMLFDAALPVDIADVDVAEDNLEVVEDSAFEYEAGDSQSFAYANQAETSVATDVATQFAEILSESDLSIASKSLVIVDTSVSDYETLIASFGENVEVKLIDPGSGGVEQITDILSNYENLDAVHIISEGGEGHLVLGSDVVWDSNVKQFSDQFESWNNSLAADADIMFYGCSTASSERGQSLISTISTLTGADVAASDDLTGNAEQGGDWDLEFATGTIDAQILVIEDYSGTLETITVTSALDDNGDGITLREAIAQANNNDATSVHDLIVFDTSLANSTIILTQGELSITSDITILGDVETDGDGSISIDSSTGVVTNINYGDGAADITIDADNTGDDLGESRHFNISSAAGSVSLDHLSLVNGAANQGGSIYVNGADLTLNYVDVNNNVTSGYGGGIYNNTGSLTLNYTSIYDNSVTGRSKGAGVYSLSASSFIVNHSTISGNTLSGGDGAGLYIQNCADFKLISSTISGNTVSGWAGAMHIVNSTTVVENSTIAYNDSGTFMNVRVSGGSFTSIGSIFAANKGGNDLELSGVSTSNIDYSWIGSANGDVTTAVGSGTGNLALNLSTTSISSTLGLYGGVTKSHALASDSVAVDKGNVAYSDTDQRDMSVQNTRRDIGAFEYKALEDTDAPNFTTSESDTVDGAVVLGSNLVISFDEVVQEGTGTIGLYKVGSNTPVEFFEINGLGTLPNSFLSLSLTNGVSSLTINPGLHLDYDLNYYVLMSEGAFTDTSENLNPTAAIDSKAGNDWVFTAVTDSNNPAPGLDSFTAEDAAGDVGVDNELVMKFNEDIQAGNGVVSLYKKVAGADSVVVENFEFIAGQLQGSGLSVAGDTLKIDPAESLEYDTEYYVLMTEGTVKDSVGKGVAEITVSTVCSFKTELDTEGPAIIGSNISGGATGVHTNSELEFTFGEALVPVADAVIGLYDGSDNLIESFTISADGSLPSGVTLSGDGKTLEINPSTSLAAGTSYYLSIPEGAFTDDAATPNTIAAVTQTFATSGNAVIEVNSIGDDATAEENGVTLREAIAQANTDTGADTITFNSDIFKDGSDTITLLSQLIITSDITIQGLDCDDNGIGDIIIVGGSGFRHFNINGDANTVVLENLVLTQGCQNASFGGSIYNQTADLTVIGSEIKNSGTTSATNGVWYGGAIADTSGETLTLETVYIHDNSTKGGQAGAGVYKKNGGTMFVYDSTFENNSSFENGGVRHGSAISIEEGNWDNTSSHSSPAFVMERSTISGNDGGYAINLKGVDSTIRYSTITANAAGGVQLDAGSSLDLVSSIVANNNSVGGIYDLNVGGDANNSYSYSWIGTTNSTTFDSGTGNKLDNTELALYSISELAQNDGAIKTHAISDSSPAYNAGYGNTGKDQRGEAIVGQRDMGAYEHSVGQTVNYAPVVDSPTLTVDEGGTVVITLGMIGVSDANAADAVTITVADVDGGRFENSGNSGVAVLSFTLSDVELGKISFVDDGNEIAPAAFTIVANDGELSSGPAVATTVNYTPVNDAPTSDDNTISMLAEDEYHEFSVSDFEFNDVDNGDEISYVTVRSLPTEGMLTLPVGEGTDAAQLGQELKELFNRVSLDGEFNAVDLRVISDSTEIQFGEIDGDLSSIEDYLVGFQLQEIRYYGPLRIVVEFTASDSSIVSRTINIGSLPVTVGMNISVSALSDLVYTPGSGDDGFVYGSFTFNVNDGIVNSTAVNIINFDVSVASPTDSPTGGTSGTTSDDSVEYVVDQPQSDLAAPQGTLAPVTQTAGVVDTLDDFDTAGEGGPQNLEQQTGIDTGVDFYTDEPQTVQQEMDDIIEQINHVLTGQHSDAATNNVVSGPTLVPQQYDDATAYSNIEGETQSTSVGADPTAPFEQILPNVFEGMNIDAAGTFDALEVKQRFENINLDGIDLNNDGRIDKDELKILLDLLNENSAIEMPLTQVIDDSLHVLDSAPKISTAFQTPFQRALNNMLS